MKNNLAFQMAGFAAATILTTCVSGCSTVAAWNPFASRTSEIALLADVPGSDQLVKTEWQASIGNPGEFELAPAFSSGAVLAANRDGTVTRIDAGRTVWSARVGATISGGVGVKDDLVVVGTPRAEVIALRLSDGGEVWRAKAGSEVLATPAITVSSVVVRSSDSRIWSLDRESGKVRWTYQRSNPPLSLRSSAGVEIADDRILAGFPGGKMIALAASDGRLLWESAVSTPKGTTELERMTDVAGTPRLARSGQVCAAAYQGSITCVEGKTGTTVWSRAGSTSVGLDVRDSLVIVSGEDGVVSAFDALSGASSWRSEAAKGRDPSRPVVMPKHVLLIDGAGFLHVLGRDTGNVIARRRVASSGGVIVAIDEERVLIQSRAGELAVIRLSAG